MKNITAIIFDLGGVLLDIDYQKTKLAFENLGAKEFDEMYSQADADPLFQRLETGKVSEEDFHKAIKPFLHKDTTTLDINSAWNAMLLDFRKESLNELKTLKKRYKLYLLSNTNYIHLQEFKKIYKQTVDDVPFESLFDKVYYSHELGLRKPNVEPFQYVIKENNLIPAETLFIDDSLQNVQGAILAGLQGLHFTPDMKVETLGL